MLPNVLFDLPLKHLDLSNNKFAGTISSDINKLSALITLKLERNDFTGHVPTSICSLVAADGLKYVSADCAIGKDENGISFQEIQCDCCTHCFLDEQINRKPDIMKRLESVSSSKLLLKDDTPQNKAASWIIYDDPLHVNHKGLYQRYIIATFGYALFPKEGPLAPSDVIKPMFDVTWGPLLGTLSQILEKSDEYTSIKLCLKAIIYSVRLASHSGMSEEE